MSETPSLSIRELKEILNRRGVSFADCLEKSDLIRRVQETGGFSDRPSSQDPSTSSTSTMLQKPRHSKRKIGSLSCLIVDNFADGGVPSAIVVFSHGFGADNQDLVDIGLNTLSRREFQQKPIRFVFPNAPLSLQGDTSRAWWMIDLQKFTRSFMQGSFQEVRNEVPPGIDHARSELIKVLEILKQEASLPWSSFILAGFSQGSMLSSDVALHLPENVGGLALFSTMLMCESLWTKLAPKHRGLKVIQSHGSSDAIIPYMTAPWYKEALAPHGLEIEFIPFQGGHGIPPEALNAFNRMLKTVVSS